MRNTDGHGRPSIRLKLALIAAGLMMSALVGCAGGPSSPASDATPLERAYERLSSHLDDCSKSYGVDPRTATGVGERQLLPREREWRSCAYEGIRAFLIPAAKHPALFAQLISEDTSMTERIAAGSMTRAERSARLDQLRATIAEQEGQTSADKSREKAERDAALVRQIRGLP